MNSIIVSRHPAAIEFIARELGNGTASYRPGLLILHGDDGQPEECVPVMDVATADDVRGKHVYGNLPLHLAALAAKVTVIEFIGAPPRGQEYSLADMDAAGAVLRTYRVLGDGVATPGEIRADHDDLRRRYGVHPR